MQRTIHTVRYRDGTRDIAFACHSDESVFQAMIRARGPVTHGCCGGGCGVCKMRVEAGSVHVFKRMSRAHISPEEECAGTLLLCCVQPRSDLLLAPAEAAAAAG